MHDVRRAADTMSKVPSFWIKRLHTDGHSRNGLASWADAIINPTKYSLLPGETDTWGEVMLIFSQLLKNGEE